MKKSLFALAAVGAFAGAAQAQSSVTVYGLLDYGFQGASQTQAGPACGTVNAANNVVTKTQNAGFTGNGESTSRLGFRGTEDLGGGLRAFFTVEAGLVLDPNGNVTGSGIFANSATGNRQTFIGLAQKGIGAASIGVQYTPIHEEVGATNAGGVNNQMGDVIYDRVGLGTNNYTASGMSTNDSYSVRTSNALVFKSEKMSGFQVKAMYVSRGIDATQTATTGGQNKNSGYGFNVNYTLQKLYVTASYQNFKQIINNAAASSAPTNINPGLGAGSTAFAPGYNTGAVTNGTNSDDTQQYYAASYDFGVLKAFVGYINRKAQNVNNANNYIQRSAQQIGVRAPITPKVQTWASVGSGSINNQGAAAPKANFTGWQIGTDYNLSKRTNLYAIYGAQNTSNATTGGYAGGTTNLVTNSTANTSWNQSSYAIGVRHTF
jgi:predicted porin